MIEHPSGRRNERGNLLFLVVLLIIPLAALGGSLISLGNRNMAEQDASKMRSMALLNAESGLDAGLAQLLDDPGNLATLLETDATTDEVRYRVTFEDLGEDEIDNDADGLVDEEDEDQYIRVTSSGSMNVLGYDAQGQPITANGANSSVKRIRAMGRALSGLPEFPFAVYLGDPNAEINLNGNSFLIDGHDTNVDGSEGPGEDVMGIATTGDPQDIVDQLTAQQEDNVTGDGGDPSVAATAPIDLQEIIDLYKGAADIKFTESESYAGDLGSYDEGEYHITHAVGTLEITGGSEGAGLLLVEGNLVIKGGWDYVGVVIVTGQIIFRGGGGGKRIMGTCLAGGDVIEQYSNNDEDFEVSGTVDVIYSSEAQQAVADAVSTFTLFGWQEL